MINHVALFNQVFSQIERCIKALVLQLSSQSNIKHKAQSKICALCSFLSKLTCQVLKSLFCGSSRLRQGCHGMWRVAVAAKEYLALERSGRCLKPIFAKLSPRQAFL